MAELEDGLGDLALSERKRSTAVRPDLRVVPEERAEGGEEDADLRDDAPGC